jgi:arylsulfatase A-like enzyme
VGSRSWRPCACPDATGLRRRKNDHPFTLDQSATFQKYLQDAGYTTALDGKFLTGWPNTTNPPHFDRFTITSGGYYGAYFRSNTGG